MRIAATILGLAACALLCARAASAEQATKTGAAAMGDWRGDRPGIIRHITPADMPKPNATPGASAMARVVARPADAKLSAPAGFRVEDVATGLSGPRTLRFAPNGDLFVAETDGDRISVLRPGGNGGALRRTTFAAGLSGVFGLAFHPAEAPRWLYVSTPMRVIRFAYQQGDLVARSAPETIVDHLPDGGHSTRDIVFARDGRTLYVAVGSQSNVAQNMGSPPADLAAFEQANGMGASWGAERGRAAVLAFDPDGGQRRTFASGLRNCVAMALRPASDDLWCVVNERDMLGDDLPPDCAAHVQQGAFYGWPWYYIGANADPRHANARQDLSSRVTIPDVLIQPHSAPLGIAFYEGAQFPAAFRGDAFVALHGSWNRAKRTGYKIVRLRFDNGRPTGAYEDFVTGFVVSDQAVWGRPVSLATAPDGSLYFSDDAGGTIRRVAYDRN